MSNKRYGLPEEIFRYKDAEQDIVDEQQEITPVDKVVFDKGIFVHLEDAPYPQKGISTPDIMYAFNLTKRHIIEPIKFLSKWYFLPGILITLFDINRPIRTFNDMTWRFIKPFILQREFMTQTCDELEWLLYSFLKKISVPDQDAIALSATIAHSIEYDNAYRLRVVDILNETDKVRMVNNPRKEIFGLVKLMLSRSVGDAIVARKFQVVANLLSLVLLIPKYKKAFISAIKEVDFEKFQMDETDKYWTCLRKEGYNYMGLTDEERNIYLERWGKKRPKLINKKDL